MSAAVLMSQYSEVHTQVTIRASAQRVWAALTDLEHYQVWNPFLVAVSGAIIPGKFLKVRAKPSGSVARTFLAEITKAEPERELRWIGRVLFRGVLDGEHIFVLNSLGPEETLLIHREEFRGVLVPFHRRLRLPDTLRGFQEMNGALKRFLEHGSPAASQ